MIADDVVMCAMMHGRRSMFETVITGLSGHGAQHDSTAATIAKRFSAMAQSGVLLLRIDMSGIGAKRTCAAASP
jgi:hypothetical protein